MKTRIAFCLFFFTSILGFPQIKHGSRDQQSRHVIPRRFVVSTNDHKGQGIDNNQYAEIIAPVNRKNIIFALHIYWDKIDFIQPVMDRFDKESEHPKINCFKMAGKQSRTAYTTSSRHSEF